MLKFKYYKNILASNSVYDRGNTYANDVGTVIQIPASKYDSHGNPIRRYVKITRKSMETLSPLVQKRIGLSKVTEIIPQRFSYPFSSLVGTKIDSRAFSQIPNRTFNCKLKKILVPSNYFPNNESEDDIRYLYSSGKYKIYEGDWDGTFKLSWSNNPAWVLMDLLINKRYGLGNYIESEQVDIWELYKIARWCDCVDDNGYYYGVSDGYGGVEPRHTFNALISDKFNIFDMINQVASVFRGHVYYMNSLITFDDDRIKPIIGEFNNSDVKDGLFNYTNHKKDDEFTATDVAFVDEKDNYKPKIEYVEDSDGIRQRGILKKQINAFGITSKSQARRFGKYFLYQTSKENLNVSFITDNRALLYRPGDLIKINDELMDSIKNYGIVKYVENIDNNTFKIVIDQKLDNSLFLDNKITLQTPIAKPKYDDYYADAQFVPSGLSLTMSSPLVYTTFKGVCSTTKTYLEASPSSYTFNMLPYESSSSIKSFSGVTTVNLTEKDASTNTQVGVVKQLKITGYFNYIPDVNMNNVLSKYGYWEFTTGNNPNSDKLAFDVLNNENLKYQLPYKNYFFTHFDTGRYYKYSGKDSLSRPIYLTYDFSTGTSNWKSVPYLKTTYSSYTPTNDAFFNLSIKKYCNPVITYNTIIEGDRPSIDTFNIKSSSFGTYSEDGIVKNEYSELIISKSGSLNSNTNTLSLSVSAVSIISNALRYIRSLPYPLLP
jgi:hypothetical protein